MLFVDNCDGKSMKLHFFFTTLPRATAKSKRRGDKNWWGNLSWTSPDYFIIPNNRILLSGENKELCFSQLLASIG